MLRTLQFVQTHPVYKLHELLGMYFQSLEPSIPYDKQLIWSVEPGFIDVINQSDSLDGLFKDLYDTAISDIALVQDAFQSNNHISDLCSSNLTPLISLDRFPGLISLPLKKLVEYLYKSTLNSRTFAKHYGSYHSHYESFVRLNGRLCAFCGLTTTPSPKIKKAAYDHYLKISNYPFSGVNFGNLVPMCDCCNESPSKGQKEVIFNNKGTTQRRTAFYPYSSFGGINIKIIITSFLEPIMTIDIVLAPIVASEKSKVEVWNEVFNIEERYRQDVFSLHDSWLKKFVIESFPNEFDLYILALHDLPALIDSYLHKLKQYPHDVEVNLIIQIPFWQEIRNKAIHYDALLYYISMKRLITNKVL